MVGVVVAVAAAVECADGSFDRAGGSSRGASHQRALGGHGSSPAVVIDSSVFLMW